MTFEDDGTRRTVEELATLHHVEPGLHEIYLEGRTDASVVEWFLRRQGTSASVYAVSDRVFIDFDIKAYGLRFGEQGKVVAVASRLAELGASQSFTCIADADYWHTLEEMPEAAKTALLTDYADLNMYCFNEKVLEQFLLVCLRAPFELSARSILSSITPLLRALFVLRWLMRQEVDDFELVNRLDRRARIEGKTLVLETAKVVADSVNGSNNPAARSINKDRVLSQHARITEDLAKVDPRKTINGHDFVDFLCFYLRAVS